MDTGDSHARARGESKSYRRDSYQAYRPAEAFTNR